MSKKSLRSIRKPGTEVLSVTTLLCAAGSLAAQNAPPAPPTSATPGVGRYAALTATITF